MYTPEQNILSSDKSSRNAMSCQKCLAFSLFVSDSLVQSVDYRGSASECRSYSTLRLVNTYVNYRQHFSVFRFLLLCDQKLGGGVGGDAGQSEGLRVRDVLSLMDLLVLLSVFFRKRVSVASSGSELSGGGSVTPSKMTLTPRLEDGSSSHACTACVMSSWMMNSSS